MLQRCLVLHTCMILLRGFAAGVLFPDLKFIDDFGWLRLHIVPATWADARLRCNIEGGVLASPTSKTVVELMKNAMYDHGLSLSKVFVDIHASEPKGYFTSIDGNPLVDLPIEWAINEPDNFSDDEECLVMTVAGKVADASCESVHPYICVKADRTKKCTSKNPDYTMDPHTLSCYKFHSEPVPWRRAAMVCATEHAHLAVINSKHEANVLKRLFEKHPKSTLTGAAYNGSYAHIGFLDPDESGDFFTVFGETLEFSGFELWEPKRPNNMTFGQHCGCMKRTGEINHVSCLDNNCPFICETSFE